MDSRAVRTMKATSGKPPKVKRQLGRLVPFLALQPLAAPSAYRSLSSLLVSWSPGTPVLY